MFTPDEIARLSGRNPEFVRDLARRGEIPAHRVGRRWLIPDEGLRILESRPRHPIQRPTLD